MTDDDILEPQDWSLPIPIACGPGRLSEIGQSCAAKGLLNPLIVTDKGSRDLPFISKLHSYLADAGLSTALFSEISPNPRDDEISTGCERFQSGNHDAITAIGGGSAMDGGKAICLTVKNGKDLWDFEWEAEPVDISLDQAFPTLITIPTTAGTGAETESTAMVTHTGKGMKFCIYHPQLQPSLALLDPELTIGLPANLTAWTGVDAMVHAIEAYCVPGFHPLCDGLALEGLSLINKWLPLAVREPDDLAARGAMLVGSCLAGISFLKGLGHAYAISHMIGAEYNTQHGLTNAIILPVVLRFNLPGMEEKVKRMAEVMGLQDVFVEGFITEIERRLDEFDIPRSLSEISVPKACEERIAEKALLDIAARTNPRAANLAEMRLLLKTSLTKARQTREKSQIMSNEFPKHTLDTAPEKSKPLLKQLLEQSGPNGFYSVTAESPETLAAYAMLHKAFMASSFTNEEKTVIWQSINVENQCHFCVPAHTYMAKTMKIDKSVSDALRDETALLTARLEALRDFTLLMLRNDGNASDAEISKFLGAGYTHQNMLEVVLGLAQKTISNYVNHLARTPVDQQYEKYAWNKVE